VPPENRVPADRSFRLVPPPPQEERVIAPRQYATQHICSELERRRSFMGDTRNTSFSDYVAAKERDAAPERRSAMDAARAHAELLYAERFGLGEQLAALRRSRKITQAELADISGVRQPEISRIEAGKGNPTQETLARLGASVGAVLSFTTVGSADGQPLLVAETPQ
jgi:XRE family transcriptional regulator, regulator of sulfur utilization